MNKFDDYLTNVDARRAERTGVERTNLVEFEDDDEAFEDDDEEAPSQQAGVLVSHRTFLIFTVCSILAVLNLVLVIWVEGDKISAKAQATWRQLHHPPTAVVYEPPSSAETYVDGCDGVIDDGATCEPIER
ncbi:MAG: hypothetical protein U0487_02260 [Patescibacteria group bacterium]